MLELSAPITSLRMVGPVFSKRLAKLNIQTIGDLVYHLPSRFENFTLISKINLLQAGEKTTLIGKIISIGNIYTKSGKRIQKAIITDETGEIEVIWYNQPFLLNILKPQTLVSIAGKTKWFGSHLVFESPEYEIVKPETKFVHTGRLVPIYPETYGVSSKWLRSRIDVLLHKLPLRIPEFLPPIIIERFHLLDEKAAIYQTHFPNNLEETQQARRRLSFDELFILQLAANIRKRLWQKETVGNRFQISDFNFQIQQFIDKLPFKLTNAQKKVTDEILTDLAKNRPMNRLLEGDVGSGKTVVAAIAMYLSHLNGFQSVLMAPTEILAEQHYDTINKFLKSYDIKIGLLTGKNRIKNKKTRFKEFNIIVGTHALLSDKTIFKKLGLVIIDEQQRFGVEQRAMLRAKGQNPHVLTMTATPIPRSIALTIYADLDLSVIDEMPKGRKQIKTWVVPLEKRGAAYKWIEKQISSPSNPQAFIICPLIEESESLTIVKAVKTEYQRLSKNIFPHLRLGLLHGKLSTKEKNNALCDFAKRKLDILVSTPVVEVGIDMPAATIMMIEAAERFGLSQLHQLRGRVGRGAQQSFCLLFSESDNPNIFTRLKYLETIFSGPKLAELDFKLRGAGEIFGIKQHGQWELKMADISDMKLVEETKKAVYFILSHDPLLRSHPHLRERLEQYTIEKVSPD